MRRRVVVKKKQRISVPAFLRRYTWKQLALISAGGLIGLLVVAQLLYPWDRLTPTAQIDGIYVGWLTRDEAAHRIADQYAKHQIGLKLGSTGLSVKSPTFEQLGGSIAATEYLEHASYPWYLRLVPTSLWWGQRVPKNAPTVSFSQKADEYIAKTLMPYCEKKPVNAGFKADGSKLVLVPSVPGGACEATGVSSAIKQVQPHLPAETAVTLPLRAIPASVTDDEATTTIKAVNARMADGLPIQAGNERVVVAPETALTWLSPKEVDGVLDIEVGGDAAKQYVEKEIAPKVSVAPGTSRITTRDFDVVSRVDGAPGRSINIDQTMTAMYRFVKSEADVATAATITVPAKEVYTRTYSSSDQALSALFENFAKDHPGSHAMTYIELDGKKRRASYQGDKQFVTASTYKLFTAYSLLKRVDDGRESWEANASCFDKMIRISDNACPEAYLHKFGLSTITSEINAIGLSNSNFTKSGGPFTTSNDLALLLGQLQSGQNFSPTGRDRLLTSLRANIFRQGIPAGANGQVANKVGFLNGLLHDAAIVYSPNGTYVLVVLSDGSSWANIAELTRQLEKVRT